MGCYNKDNAVNVIDSSNKRLAIQNLAVNKDNVKMNFELTDIVYDKNLLFRNGYFIYDNLSEDNLATEYVMTGLSQTPVQNFTYTINKTDFFKDPDTAELVMSDYYIGYCLTHNGQVIAEEETLDDTLDIDIQPIEFLKHNFAVWKSNTYYLKDDYNRGKEVYQKVTEAIQAGSDYKPTASDEAVVRQLENNSLTGYDYEVVFTIRRKNGFRYYSNPTTISFIISSTNRMLVGAPYIDEVETVLVNVNYPDEVELNAGTEQTTGNIRWEFNSLTADKNNPGDNTLEIFSEDTDIKIKSILLNSRDITSMITAKNNWITLTKKTSVDNPDEILYDVIVNDNIPDIKDTEGNVYSTTDAESYMKLLCDNAGENSRIFSVLDKNYKPMSTKERSVCLTAVYEKLGKEYFEKFIIRQPGFQDPRTIPGAELKLSSCYDELADINKIENGVLCNQFRTYLDIEITGFNVENWGAYGTDNVYMDIELKNIDYDNQNILKYSIENPYRRPTFKFITTDEYSLSRYQLYDRYGSFYKVPMESVLQNHASLDKAGILGDYYNDMLMKPHVVFPDLMNHYELGFRTENYPDNFSVRQDVYLTSAVSAKKHTNAYTDGYKTFVVMDSNFVKACQKPYEAVSGMFHDITLKFSKLPVSEITKNNKIRVAVDFAMGNPI